MNDIPTQIIVSEEARVYARLPYRVRLEAQPCGDMTRFVAQHPELLGCLADGDTQDEAVAHLGEVTAEFVQMLIDAGAPIPLPLPFVTASPGTTEMGSISIHLPVALGVPAHRAPQEQSEETANDSLLRPFSYQKGSGVLCEA